MRVLRGTVTSGLGNFSAWIDRLQDHYWQKPGMHLFPGTLNLQLAQPYSLPREVLRLEREEYGGTVSVTLVPCRIFQRKAFILRTDQSERGQGHHPKTVVEVACDVKLRDLYHLVDGDVVEIEVPE